MAGVRSREAADASSGRSGGSDGMLLTAARSGLIAGLRVICKLLKVTPKRGAPLS